MDHPVEPVPAVVRDERRVCDLNAAELLEAAVGSCESFGWTAGRWVFELHVNDGYVRRVVPTQVEDVPIRVVIGRHQLEHVSGSGELVGRRDPDELGSAA